MSKILENLFVGSHHNAQDIGFMNRHRITHLLQIASEIPPKFPQRFQYCIVRIGNHNGAKIGPYLESSLDFIHSTITTPNHNTITRDGHLQIATSTRKSNKRVLVYCSDGISRAPTFVIAYLMQHQKIEFEEAFSTCKKMHPKTNPIQGFVL